MYTPAACNIGPPPVFSHSFETTSDQIVINYVMMRWLWSNDVKLWSYLKEIFFLAKRKLLGDIGVIKPLFSHLGSEG